MRTVSKVIDRPATRLYISVFEPVVEINAEMSEQPILAAGGIVVRGNTRPTVAVVQLRKDGNWVLPKGKLNRGEDARTAAEREVHEETGHTVTVKEFVGTLCYEVNGRSKIVQFWRMHPNGGPARELMNDIKQVAWLPLDKAIRKLARPHEKAFLASAGPAAIRSHRQTTAIRAVPPAAGVEPVDEPAPAIEPAPNAPGTFGRPLSRRRKLIERALTWLKRRRA